MALKATIYKADLQIADMDRHYYADRSVTIARHPSETDERMMVRLLAFILNAHEYLSFGKGLSAEDEPDLLRMDLTGAIELWIDVGNPDEKRIVKASRRARQVQVFTYSHNSTVWWKQVTERFGTVDNLSVFHLPPASSEELTRLAQRTMQLQCTIQEGQLLISGGDNAVQIELDVWKRAATH
jgi:uncharacterized protein YaeQ